MQARRVKKGTKKLLPLLLASTLTGSLGSRQVFADDDPKNGAAAASHAGKFDSPKPSLTERERWLLDRVEQLEKRVAELESKSQPAATAPSPSAALASSTTETAGLAAAGTPAIATPTAGVAMAPVVTSAPAIAKESAEPATRAETKPRTAEPFAFADFTWLNGNPRTKT